MEFDEIIHLREWPARNEKISILLRVRETIDRMTRTLIKSSVLLCYYAIGETSIKHLHSMHFDYGGEENYHPVFHAQLCKDTIDLTDDQKEQLDFNFTIEPSTVTCFRECRIPTCDMTFASVLLCLAADHIRDNFFKEFLENVRRDQMKLPMPTFASTKDSISKDPGHLKSSHWFAHMTN